MARPQTAVRLRTDACPGVMRLTEADDGWLARIRLVGGFVTAQGFSGVAEIADEMGNGRVELTSRGNLQVRGLIADAGGELSLRLAFAGLFPSASHERVRNIVASPLAGLDQGADLRSCVRSLDEAICASPRLADLSGRFLFAIDDGRGDVAHLGADVVIQRGAVNGLPVSDPIVGALAFAQGFLDEREAQNSGAWRIADLIDGHRRVRDRAVVQLGVAVTAPGYEKAPYCPPPQAGTVAGMNGHVSLVLAVPLGQLDARKLTWLATTLDQQTARVTPWRSIVLPNITPGTIEAAIEHGFAAVPDTPWSATSACTGKPGCAKALADVQADAKASLGRWPDRRVHWSGCDRRCGRPNHTDIDVVATPTGYRIDGA